MLRVDAQTHVNLDGLVELGEFDLLEKGNRLGERVITRFDLFERSLVFFSGFSCHISSLVRTVALKGAHLPLSPVVGVREKISM